MKRNLSLVLLLPSLLAMGWLVSQAQVFWRQRPDLHFGWIVLLLCAYLFWESWERRPPFDWRVRWWGLLPLIAGAGLLFLVQVYQTAFGTNSASTQGLAMGVLLFAAGNIALVFGGPGVRRFAMPYAFLLVALPLPGMIQGPLINGLQHKVAYMNTEILNLIGVPAQQVGSLIQLPSGTVGIDEACSGIRSLQSTIMAALFIGYLTLRSYALRIFLLVSGVVLAVIGNVIRSLYLCLTANARGVNAVDAVHDSAGWSVLAFTAVGVVLLAWLMARLEKAAARHLASHPTGAATVPEG